MKNYLIGAVRPIIKNWGYWKGTGDNPKAERDLMDYENMYSISRSSAKTYLQGEWEEIKLTAPVLDSRAYQIAHWYMIKELWHKEPCNILCMGADTMFLKPTEVFGKYNDMMMFNYTDPKTHEEAQHYFNDDIRYYPADMDPKVWDLGERLMDKWFTHKENDWSWGQLIHNYQLWSQGLDVSDVHDPKMAFQIFNLNIPFAEEWNNCKLEDANIIHLHSSRDTTSRVDAMRQLAGKFDIPVNIKEETIVL